ncbi:hypothetical protein RJT34_01282 [Clitoria ternatea]|uniref:Uncharacterized protein n=1 Tax=Clitoria ternatea TaxID=43366 RepID=A0AAN9KIT9_CLITE
MHLVSYYPQFHNAIKSCSSSKLWNQFLTYIPSNFQVVECVWFIVERFLHSVGTKPKPYLVNEILFCLSSNFV